MFFFIGLGNPGSQYDGTRHNVGFEVVDALSTTLEMPFRAGKGEYLESVGQYRGAKIGLAKPLTYMNNSGSAVMEIQERYNVSPEKVFIICDDFWLPLGSLRLRTQGSDGGHNGLYSIIYHLQSESFPRLRCGIAAASMPAEKSRMADFVLDQFSTDERRTVNEMIQWAKNACLMAAIEGISKAMNLYNVSMLK